MASRNAGGGSQGLGRQSSVATTSGSVMKSRQVVSFIVDSLFSFILLLGFFSWSLELLAIKLTNVHKTHLQSQLALLSQNLSDTENLLRMTSVQAEAMKGLGSWHGGL